MAIVRDALTATSLDEIACAELYRRTFPTLLGLVRQRIGRPDAEDVVQTIFTRLWYRWSKGALEAEQRGDAALLRAVRNGVRDFLRRKGKQLKVVPLDDTLEENGVVPSVPPVEPHEEDPRLRIARQCIAQLPPRCRKFFDLVHDDKCTYEEAAEIAGVRVSTVKGQLKRAHRLTQAAFKNAGYQLPAGAERKALAPSTETPNG